MVSWDSPGITTELFDKLLDDIIKTTVERVLEANELWESLPPSIYMALWDRKKHERNWASIDVVDGGEGENANNVIMAAAGRMAIQRDQIPVAAYWCRRARMESSASDQSYNGLIVLGMTEDNRVNGGFLAIDVESKPIGVQVWHAGDMNDTNTLDSGVIDSLFISARSAYRQSEMNKANTSRDELAKQLFRNVRGFDEGDELKL